MAEETKLAVLVLEESRSGRVAWVPATGIPGEYVADWRDRRLFLTYYQDESPTLRIFEPDKTSPGEETAWLRGDLAHGEIREALVELDQLLHERFFPETGFLAVPRAPFDRERQHREIQRLLA